MIDTLERTFGKLQGSAKRVGKLSWEKKLLTEMVDIAGYTFAIREYL